MYIFFTGPTNICERRPELGFVPSPDSSSPFQSFYQVSNFIININPSKLCIAKNFKYFYLPPCRFAKRRFAEQRFAERRFIETV
jgi:hypothetical protein